MLRAQATRLGVPSQNKTEAWIFVEVWISLIFYILNSHKMFIFWITYYLFRHLLFKTNISGKNIVITKKIIITMINQKEKEISRTFVIEEAIHFTNEVLFLKYFLINIDENLTAVFPKNKF